MFTTISHWWSVSRPHDIRCRTSIRKTSFQFMLQLADSWTVSETRETDALELGQRRILTLADLGPQCDYNTFV